MENRKQYWPVPLHNDPRFGVYVEMRSEFAWRLLEHFSVVAAREDGEDTAGRSKLSLQTPQELVTRAFQVTDEFFDRAEQRGEIRTDTMSEEERAAAVGRLEGIKTRAAFPSRKIDEELSKQR